MLINLSEILSAGVLGTVDTGHIDTNIDLEDFVYGADKVHVKEGIHIDMHIVKSSKEELTLNGSLDGKLQLACSRCNAPLDYSLNVEFSKIISSKDFNDSEGSFDTFEGMLKGELLDIKALALNEILLNFPMKVLCMPTCKGLCPQCGINKNEASCTCETDDIDPRWLGLKSLYDEKFKEV